MNASAGSPIACMHITAPSGMNGVKGGAQGHGAQGLLHVEATYQVVHYDSRIIGGTDKVDAHSCAHAGPTMVMPVCLCREALAQRQNATRESRRS